MIEVNGKQLAVSGSPEDLMNELAGIYLNVVQGVLEAASDDEKETAARVWDAVTDVIAARAHEMCSAYRRRTEA